MNTNNYFYLGFNLDGDLKDGCSLDAHGNLQFMDAERELENLLQDALLPKEQFEKKVQALQQKHIPLGHTVSFDSDAHKLAALFNVKQIFFGLDEKSKFQLAQHLRTVSALFDSKVKKKTETADELSYLSQKQAQKLLWLQEKAELFINTQLELEALADKQLKEALEPLLSIDPGIAHWIILLHKGSHPQAVPHALNLLKLITSDKSSKAGHFFQKILRVLVESERKGTPVPDLLHLIEKMAASSSSPIGNVLEWFVFLSNKLKITELEKCFDFDQELFLQIVSVPFTEESSFAALLYRTYLSNTPFVDSHLKEILLLPVSISSKILEKASSGSEIERDRARILLGFTGIGPDAFLQLVRLINTVPEAWLNKALEAFSLKPDLALELLRRCKDPKSLTLKTMSSIAESPGASSVMDALKPTAEKSIWHDWEIKVKLEWAEKNLEKDNPELYKKYTAWSEKLFSKNKWPYRNTLYAALQFLMDKPDLADPFFMLTDQEGPLVPRAINLVSSMQVINLTEDWQINLMHTCMRRESNKNAHIAALFLVSDVEDKELCSDTFALWERHPDFMATIINRLDFNQFTHTQELISAFTLLYKKRHEVEEDMFQWTNLFGALHSSDKLDFLPFIKLYQSNPELGRTLLSLMHRHPNLLVQLTKTLSSEPIPPFYQELIKLNERYRASPKDRLFFIENLLRLVEKGADHAALQILSMANQGEFRLAHILLDSAVSGYLSTVSRLLPIQSSHEPLREILLARIEKQPIEMTDKLLQLYDRNHPFSRFICSEVVHGKKELSGNKNVLEFALSASTDALDRALRVFNERKTSPEDLFLKNVILLGNLSLFEKWNLISTPLKEKLMPIKSTTKEGQLLIEQLIDIYMILKKKKPPKHPSWVMGFSLRAAEWHDTKKGTELLGKVIFLISRDQPLPEQIMSQKSLETAFDSVFKKEVDDKIDKYQLGKKDSFNFASATDKQFALETKLSIEAAALLLPCQGCLNWAMSSLLQHPQSGVLKKTESFQGQLRDVLGELENNAPLRAALLAIKKPPEGSPMIPLIRLTCGLKDDEPVTDLLTQRTVLSAMMTRLRQRKVGSCFATGLAIDIQKNNIPRLFKDLTELIEKGNLTRNVEGMEVVIPFLPYKDPNVAKVIVEHPLLRAWEYTIANMDSRRKELGDFLVKAITSQKGSLFSLWNKTLRNNEELELSKELLEEIGRHIEAQFTYLFDPTVPLQLEKTERTVDDISGFGGWVLFDQAGQEDVNLWHRLDSPAKLSQRIISLLHELAQTSSGDKKELVHRLLRRCEKHDSLLRTILQSVTGDFHQRSLVSLEEKSKSIINKLWEPTGGGWSAALVPFYIETASTQWEEGCYMPSGEHLLPYFLELFETLPSGIFQNKNIGMGMPGHALSLIKHPSQLEYLKEGISFFTKNKDNIANTTVRLWFYSPQYLLRTIEQAIGKEASGHIYRIWEAMEEQKQVKGTLGEFLTHLPFLAEMATGTTSDTKKLIYEVEKSILNNYEKDLPILHLADGNWDRGAEGFWIFYTENVMNRHMGLYYSPVTGRLGLCSVNEDGTIPIAKKFIKGEWSAHLTNLQLYTKLDAY